MGTDTTTPARPGPDTGAPGFLARAIASEPGYHLTHGCGPHGVTAGDVAQYAVAAAERYGTHVGRCQCCGGPSPKRRVSTPEGQPLEWVEFPYCGLCGEGMSYAEQLGYMACVMDAGEYSSWLDGQAQRSRAEGVGE